MLKTEHKLTPKQELFCKEYIACNFNATQAAINAGYSGNAVTIRQTASENLTKPHITAYLEELRAGHREQIDCDTQWVVARTQETYSTAQEGEAYGPAVAALNLLAKHTGGFDKSNEGININNIQVTITKHGDK